MPLDPAFPDRWQVRKIGVIGPGIVGMPMAALLADAAVRLGTEQPAEVVVVQRDSPTSGWKVAAINQGRSPIGGVEPELDDIVSRAVANGRLRASHVPGELWDADVVLVCVQTDKNGIEPDYGPLFSALEGLVSALVDRPAGNVPLVIFESTLAPTSLTTLVRDFFASRGLVEGRDVLLGNSPNRVMPGRLVERVAQSDKLAGGLSAITPDLIVRLYRHIVTSGVLHPTNSLTAEVVKTLENAYRDVRIAFAAEVARYCDAHDIDFYDLRDRVNEQLHQSDRSSSNPQAVPSGGLLIPTVGVGGHCLPKDGILLWWRALEAELATDRSLILVAREVNDSSPGATLAMIDEVSRDPSDGKVALLGLAYRFDSEDTRNSPTIALARLLLEAGRSIIIHDPYVNPKDQNLVAAELTPYFTRDLGRALDQAAVAVFCTGHSIYGKEMERLLASNQGLAAVVDACNLVPRSEAEERGLRYRGIGRGRRPANEELIAEVIRLFRIVETGVANEVSALIDFYNRRFTEDRFSAAEFSVVRRLAATCVTGCQLGQPGAVAEMSTMIPSRLVAAAAGLETSAR